MRLILALVGLAGPVWADADLPAAKEDLVGRTVVYAGGETQDFRASGRTLYDAGAPSWGYWEMRDGRYCSQWPPVRDWDCYAVTLSPDGKRLQFVDEWGNETIGTFTD